MYYLLFFFFFFFFLLFLFYFFFFFQAEDGIRDHCVTGVQTCALPISHGRDRAHRPGRGCGARLRARRQALGDRDRAGEVLPAPRRRRRHHRRPRRVPHRRRPLHGRRERVEPRG